MGHVAHIGEMRNTYKTFVEKSEGKCSLGRPKHRLEDNIRLDLKETGCEAVELIHAALYRDELELLEHGNKQLGFVTGG
jgi:hypothetical protein